MENTPDKTIFISRAGADRDLAIRIAAILRGARYTVILQDDTFGHGSFMESMDEALRSGARVVALLSGEYLQSEFCRAEWQAAITRDPLNRHQRLVVFRVGECNPVGLLGPLRYTDLCRVREDVAALTPIVLDAVGRGSIAGDNSPGTLVDPDATWEVPSFTGRGQALQELRAALFAEGGAAVTAVHGTGGMGKSALAREYARSNRQEYSILWWLNAETEDGIIGGLIRLGARYIPDLDQSKDRTEAAKLALERVFAPLHKPALLVFDNVEKQELLRKWKPHENCHVLVTSRLHGWGGGFRPVEIKEWPPEDACDYLVRESARPDLKDAGADEIAKTLGYLPLALAHTAAVLRDNPAMTAKSYLARIETLLDRAPEGAEYGKAVYATFQEALAQAEKRAPGAAAILCLAAFYAPDDIPFELFEQEPEIYPDDLAPTFDGSRVAASLHTAVSDLQLREDALSALAALSLITLDLQTRVFSAHRLVQAACRDLIQAKRTEWVQLAVEVANAVYP
ncbi:MAG TPA: TIR domain-containing protein, partial [Rhizomicrobium sp.]|nr:TIR domain-containing protein [Rhizomicrobium sp.]